MSVDSGGGVRGLQVQEQKNLPRVHSRLEMVATKERRVGASLQGSGPASSQMKFSAQRCACSPPLLWLATIASNSPMAILRPSERVTNTSAHGLAAKQSSEGKSTKESPARKVVKHPAYRLQAVSGASSRMIHANAPDGSCSARANRLGRSKGVQD